jgi:hypothetical protein
MAKGNFLWQELHQVWREFLQVVDGQCEADFVSENRAEMAQKWCGFSGSVDGGSCRGAGRGCAGKAGLGAGLSEVDAYICKDHQRRDFPVWRWSFRKNIFTG